MLPLAFGAHAGSLLALTGTPVNVIVSDAAADAGVGASGSSRSRWSACRWSPARSRSSCSSASGCCRSGRPRSIAPDFSDHARTLIAQYELDHPEEALLTRRVRRGRGGDPAALGAGRRPGVPGHGHRERRPRRARRAAPGRGRRRGRDRARGGRHAAAAGHVGGARSPTSTTSEVLVVDPPELVRRQAVPLGRGREARAGRAGGAWSSLLATGVVPAGGRRAGRRRARWCCSAC